jgi:ketosteroid isomerase-like protein
MDNIALAKSIFQAEDFQPLLDRLADDVVFKATIPEGTPISGEFRGKRAVIGYFATLGEVATFRQEEPLEFFGDCERVVVLGDDSFEIKKSGTTARSEYAIVVDFRDGLITSILIIQDLSAIADAYRTDSRGGHGAAGG